MITMRYEFKSGKDNPSYSHGKSKTKLYTVWLALKQRCTNVRDKSYPHYGARGITVCDEWLNNFQIFYLWSMLNGYKEGLQIDRIDNDKGYSSDNCRWTTCSKNNQNRRCTKLNWEIVDEIRSLRKGSDMTLEQIAEKFNISFSHVGNIVHNRKWKVQE